MSQNYLFILILFVLSISCEPSKSLKVQLLKELDNLKREHVVDNSLEFNDLNIDQSNGKYIITGMTSNENLFIDLCNYVEENTIISKVLLLPDTSLKDSTYGIVNVSVAPIREKPSHMSQMIDQSILGNTLKILYANEDWYLCQTHYNYVGWITKSVVSRCDSSQYSNWNSKARHKITKVNSFIYSAPFLSSKPISDLVLNSRLKVNFFNNDWLETILPNNKIGYVLNNDIEIDSSDLQGREFKVVLLEKAYSMMGVPYLWGGNSSKGNDCSGFVQTVYTALNISLPRDARQQAKLGTLIKPENAEIGDLFFFGQDDRVTHVAISIGGLDYIHQGAKFEGRVCINSLNPSSTTYSKYRYETFLFAKRPFTHKNEN